jgi:hypothetical protein
VSPKSTPSTEKTCARVSGSDSRNCPIEPVASMMNTRCARRRSASANAANASSSPSEACRSVTAPSRRDDAPVPNQYETCRRGAAIAQFRPLFPDGLPACRVVHAVLLVLYIRLAVPVATVQYCTVQ